VPVFLKIALYVVIALVLAMADLLFYRRVRSEFRTKDNLPPVITPFHVIGRPGTDGDKAGEVMAQMLVARTYSLNREIDAAISLLAHPPEKQDDQSAGASGTGPPASAPLRLQNYGALAEPVAVAMLGPQAPDMKVSVAGVEVSGVIAWIQRTVDVDRTITVGVSYSATGCRGVMSPRAESASDGWIETSAADEVALIENLAYAMHKRWMGAATPAIAAMGLDDFKTYIAVVRDAAGLNRATARNSATSQEYDALNTRMATVTDALPDNAAGAVYDLAAQIAERANHFGRAAQLYARAARDSQLPDADRKQLKAKAATLREKDLAARAAVTATQNAGSPLDDILKQLGVTNVAMQSKPTVTIIGPDPAKTAAGDMLRDYMTGLSGLVHSIAPDAVITYAWEQQHAMHLPAGGVDATTLLVSFDAALKASPKVILCPFGPLAVAHGPFSGALRFAAGKAVIVLPAGNDPKYNGPPIAAETAAQIAIVAAARRDGTRTVLTQADPFSLWTVGADVPMKQADGTVTLQSGTSIASALAAGIAARVIDRKQNLKPGEVVELLRRTSRPTVAGGVRLLNLDAALQ
jgi:hypothetical protein